MARERDNSVSLLSLNMPFLLLYIFRLFSVFPLRFSSVFSQIYIWYLIVAETEQFQINSAVQVL